MEIYDDEHLRNMFAVSVLDGDGNEDRRTARLCATITTEINNALRRCGKDVPDDAYRTEEQFMPDIKRTTKQARQQVQSWDEMRANLGF